MLPPSWAYSGLCCAPRVDLPQAASHRLPHHFTHPLSQPPTWQFSGKRKQRQDGRVLLLFDINGVLMQHRWDGVSHQVRACFMSCCLAAGNAGSGVHAAVWY